MPAEFAKFSRRFGFNNVFALRVVGTAVEDAKASAFFYHRAGLAFRTFHTGVARVGAVGVLGFSNEFAFGIATASDEHQIGRASCRERV